MTKEVLLLEEILKLQQKIVPEVVDLLEKRYNILRTIFYKQPIGRRILANDLGIGERVVRTEINFLKNQNLIEINTPGMTITPEGEEVIDKLKNFIHELRGLSDIEKIIRERLKLKNVIVVPGNLDEDPTVIKELGRVAANYLKSSIVENSIVALTGGSTVKEVVDNMPKIQGISNVTVVPARGGMGRNVLTQANTIVAKLADKINANYRLLHVPDNLSNKALSTIVNEKGVKDVLEVIHNANILVFGIGRADEMGRRRGMSAEELTRLEELGAVGEAFGYYFNRNGEIVYSTPTIGIKNDQIQKLKTLIAIAGGENKAESILATELNNDNSVLITDEGAARKILQYIKNT